MVSNKALRNIYANYRAMKHGFWFYRTKNFTIPKSITIGGTKKSIKANHEMSKMFMEIFLYDEYFLRKLKTESIKTIIDIGANVGIFSITACSFFPNSIIHSYEPNPDIYKVLLLNGDEFNFESVCAAIGSKSCSGKLIQEGTAGCLSKFIINEKGHDRMLAFEQILNRQGTSHIDLVKIDCEGCEYDLLKQREVWDDVKFLTMEFHENDLDSVSKILAKINYKVIYSMTYPFYTGIVLAKNLNFSRK